MSTSATPHQGTARDSVWPELLSDAQAVAAYVSELSSYEVCEEQIEEQYHGCRAKLIWLELSSLALGDDDHNVREEDRQEAVDSLPVATMPPLLVEDSSLQDGYHRLRKLLADGVTHHWAYVIEVIPEDVLEVKAKKPSRWDALYDLSP